MTERRLLLGFMLLWVLTSTATRAQEVLVCQRVDSLSGKPEGYYSRWRFPSDGATVYLYYTNGPEPLPYPIVFFKVYEYRNGKPVLLGERDVFSENYRWVSQRYRFAHSGIFRIEVVAPDGSVLASTSAEVEIMDANAIFNQDPYYHKAKLSFGTGVEEGMLYGETDTFALKQGEVSVTLVLSHETLLRAPGFQVDVHALDMGAKPVLVHQLNWTTQPTWTFVHGELRFSDPGRYRCTVTDPSRGMVATRMLVILPDP